MPSQPFTNAAEFHNLHDAIGLVGRGTIWQWLLQYGWAAVLQILPILLSGGKNLTVAQLIAWGEAALAAIAAGQPLPAGPPLP